MSVQQQVTALMSQQVIKIKLDGGDWSTSHPATLPQGRTWALTEKKARCTREQVWTI
jgi:hypothetical protein